MIRFREKFTFLNSPDCPDILKILVSDMFTAYGRYKEAFARLEATPDDVSSLSTAQEAQAVVENFIANREIWDELEYYRENGKILGKCEKVKSLSVRKGVENLSDIDIQKALNNARANLSKNRAKLEQAGDDEKKKTSALALIQKWETTQKAIEEEIEARKKSSRTYCQSDRETATDHKEPGPFLSPLRPLGAGAPAQDINPPDRKRRKPA